MNYRFDKIAFNSTVKKTPTESDKEHYIGLEHIDSECLEITRWGSDVAPIGEKLIMKKGDVLFGKRRAYQRKLAIAPFDGIFSAHGMVLRPNEEVVDKNYFPFFMSSDLFMERAVQISVGGLSPTINWKDLREQEFPLPSLAEQKVLADKLWAAYRLKESYKKLLSATEEMVKSQFIEMFGSIQNGAQWPLRKLSEICTMVNGFAFKSSQYSNTGYSVIRIANVQKGYIDDSDRVYYPTDLEAVFSESILKEGDILISLTGNVGRVGLISEKHLPAALNQRVQGLRINDETLIDRDFLFNILNLDEFESLCIENSSGSAQLNLSTIWVREFPIICPAFEKQREFSKFAQQADKSGFELRKSIDAIDAVIKSLINS